MTLPAGSWTGTFPFSNYEPCHRESGRGHWLQNSAKFKGYFWTLGLPRKVGRWSSINWTSHRSDYGLMTYLLFCKVKFKVPKKASCNHPHTAMFELWSCTQESTTSVLHIIGHDRAQGYSVFYPQNLGIKYHTRRNLLRVNVHDHLKAVSCFWETCTFLRFGKSVPCMTAHIWD